MSWVLSVVHVIALSVVTLVSAWSWFQWKYRRQLRVARKLPTVLPALPVLGHLLYANIKVKAQDPMWQIFRGHPEKEVSCFWLGPMPWFLLNNPEHIRVVLNNSQTLGKATLYESFKFFFGNGLLTAPVHLWKKSRKELNPVFSHQNIQHFFSVFTASSDILVQELSKHVGGEHFDSEPYMFTYSVMNILRILLGPDAQIDINSSEFKDVIKAIKTLGDVAGERILNPFLMSDTIFQIVKHRSIKLVDNIRKLLMERTLQEENAVLNSLEDNSKVKTLQNVLKLLKSMDPAFDEDYIVKEYNTLISAGTDTVATTISSCLVVLGTEPEVQTKLYKEIISVVGKGPEPLSWEDVNSMTYLDQVLKECMRRFTIAPVISRRCEKDIQLGDCTIPDGSTVSISLFGLHMNEDVFPDPLRFDPDRFSRENVAKRDNYCFLPFSGGPRNCIGKNYAILSMKTALVQLLRNYEISSDVDLNQTTYIYSITMKSAEGYNIKIRKRV